jgi:cellulose synthase/poly-beta-1,6-N-acetylglucosamine synthase-like glycosyltransferase
LVHECGLRDPRIKLLSDLERKGKPTALNRLRQAARGDVLIMNDVRQPLAPNAVSELVRALRDPRIGCVSGNLILAGGAGAGAYWRYEKLIRGCEAELGTMAGVSGSIYAIRRDDFPELPKNIILDDMWVPLSVAMRKKRVVLAEAACAFDEAFDDEREFARKVRTLAGNYQLVSSMPEILLPFVNPTWFPLVSHKLMRLFCPWALVLLFTSTLAIAFGIQASAHAGESVPSFEIWLWRSLAAAQIAFYTLALFGQRAGKLGSLARTFAVLNLAAVVGLWRWLRGTQAVTW